MTAEQNDLTMRPITGREELDLFSQLSVRSASLTGSHTTAMSISLLRSTLVFSPTNEPKMGKLPLHIDVNATDRDQDAELERLLKLGARPADIGQTGEEPWHCLADPEGNEFCLLRARLS